MIPARLVLCSDPRRTCSLSSDPSLTGAEVRCPLCRVFPAVLGMSAWNECARTQQISPAPALFYSVNKLAPQLSAPCCPTLHTICVPATQLTTHCAAFFLLSFSRHVSRALSLIYVCPGTGGSWSWSPDRSLSLVLGLEYSTVFLVLWPSF